jgi:AhpC/TSA family
VSEREPDPPDEPAPYRLDPDRAAAAAGAGRRKQPEPVIDTRPYRWTIGIFGLALLIAFSIYTFASRGVQSPGVAPGKRLHYFVAPLATSNLNGDANVNPRCDPAAPNPQALNVCGREPLVLGLFVAGSTDCKRQVDTIQTVSRQFPGSAVQFAAVAVQASRATTAALVRSHHWTIPVAYDHDGAVAATYGVEICPMVELAYRGGVVSDRLIGNHWLAPAALAAKVRAMLSRQR